MPDSVTLSYGTALVDLDAAPQRLLSWDIPVLVLDDGYRAHLASGRDPKAWTGNFLARGPVTLSIDSEDVPALSEVWRRGARLTWVEDGATRYCYIWTAEPPRVVGHGDWWHVALVGERHYALDTGVAYAAQTVNALATVDFPGSGESAIPGDPGIPAETRLKTTWAQSIQLAAIGVKPSPGAAYNPLDDYAAVATTLVDSAQTACGTAPTIDTNDNRGSHIPFVRASNASSVIGNVLVAVWSKVTGSAIAKYKEAQYPTVPSTVKSGGGYGVEQTPRIEIPCATVPKITTGSGWTDTAAMITQSSGSSLATLPAGRQGNTFTWTGGKLVSILAKLKNISGSVQNVTMRLYETSAGLPTTLIGEVAGSVASGFDSTKVYTGFDIVLPAGVYAWALEFNAASIQVYKNTANPYADGTFVSYGASWSAAAGTDAYFIVSGQTTLGFNTTTQIYGEDTQSASTVMTLDALVRIPIDAGAIVWAPTAATTAGEGLLLDNTADEPEAVDAAYLCDADGTAPSPVSDVRQYGIVRVWPGEVNRVVSVAYTLPATSAVGNVTHQLTAIGRYARLGSERP